MADRLKKTLDALEGHRTHLLVLLTTIVLLVRLVIMPDERFLEGLDTFSDYIIGVAAVLLGSKIGDAVKKRMAHDANGN